MMTIDRQQWSECLTTVKAICEAKWLASYECAVHFHHTLIYPHFIGNGRILLNQTQSNSRLSWTSLIIYDSLVICHKHDSAHLIFTFDEIESIFHSSWALNFKVTFKFCWSTVLLSAMAVSILNKQCRKKDAHSAHSSQIFTQTFTNF